MRFSCLILIIFFLLIPFKGFSQNTIITIQKENISLEQLFVEIEQQTAIKFLYRDENVAGKRVIVFAENTPVSVVLNNALKTHGLKYTLMENNLIVVSPEEITVATEVRKSDRYISGRITDTEDKEPMPGASVFFDNTTIGTTTDANGQYRLKIPGHGNYRLTVSHVGYQSVFMDIEPGNTAIKFDIALQSTELEELTVAQKIKFRQTDINLFWRTILGKNPSRKTIQATNPEAVYYYYNPETKILKVTCREPLQIVNYETGYQIYYVLNYFTHDYNTGFTDWRYQSAFTELEPQNPKQKDTWEKNRKEVYDISLTKFIKSLYNNTLQNDGFVLANINLSLVGRDDIVQTDSATNSKTINADGLLLLICYGKPVTNRDLTRLESLQQNPLQTSVQVLPPPDRTPGASYTATMEERLRQEALKERINASRQLKETENMTARFNNQGKIMNLLQGDSIQIFPDGTFTNTISMGRVNNSESLMGIGMRLPVEYATEVSIPLAMEVKSDEKKFLLDDIAQYFDKQLSIYPQEKIHLHTDRDYYVPGERIWFKAYVTDAATHQHTTQSRYVYVELISPVDTLVYRVIIRPENDMYHGYLFLSEIIPEGNYTLRAYTRYMENLGDDYFFKKNIRIGNLEGGNEGRSGNRGNRESRGNRNNFDVTFFPEGGNLVEGVWNKVAFKALNQMGHFETITGTIVDETGAEITSVQTLYAGMGVFAYIPESGKRCFLKCRNENGLEKQFELPMPNPRANTLSITQNNKRISVSIRISPQSPNSSNIPFYLLAQCRGEVLYFSVWDQKNEYITFAEEGFPSGIIQFVLFDEQMNPLSERLVFNKNYTHDVATVEFQTDKTSYEKREKVIATISEATSLPPSLSGRAGVGLSSFSVSITDDADIAVDSATTILSSLLLSSELKGYIENPAWYLQDNIQSSTALDYLMMTHGWRRYNIPEVVKGNPEVPKIPFQKGQQLSGKVRGLLLRPVADSEVLIVAEDGDYGITTTDEKGTFMFRDFEYPDSVSFILHALSRRGSDRVELVLDKESFPTPERVPFVETDNNPSLQTNDFIVKAEQRAKYDENMRVIRLDAIEVSAQRIESKEERRLDFWVNTISDYTVRRDIFERFHFLHLAQYLTFVPGVKIAIDSDDIWRYNISFCHLCPPPLILVDGFQQDNIDDLSPDMVESIDIIKYGNTAGLGVRGGNGIISITTRGGVSNEEIKKTNQTVCTPLGYQKPVEFYSPKYETLESKHFTIPDYRTTIFWKPDVVISDEQEEASFEFYTSDFPTTYSVVIEGLTTDGKIVRQVEKIHVK